MNFVGVRAALAGGHQDAIVLLAAGEAEVPRPADLRCHNAECELYMLRPEADEVAETPGSQPDRCASCGQQLQTYTDSNE